MSPWIWVDFPVSSRIISSQSCMCGIFSRWWFVPSIFLKKFFMHTKPLTDLSKSEKKSKDFMIFFVVLPSRTLLCTTSAITKTAQSCGKFSGSWTLLPWVNCRVRIYRLVFDWLGLLPPFFLSQPHAIGRPAQSSHACKRTQPIKPALQEAYSSYTRKTVGLFSVHGLSHCCRAILYEINWKKLCTLFKGTEVVCSKWFT